jgi:endonuclease/exonuclease/phosphatase family metal-dependent hydrolase
MIIKSRKINKLTIIFINILAIIIFFSCTSVDYINRNSKPITKEFEEKNEIRIATYNIKAIYDKEEDQIKNLMEFIKRGEFDFVVFQELFDESSRCEIIEKTDADFYRTIISRVDYNSFPEFLFQDSGLFMKSSFPKIDLSSIKFGNSIKNSNGVIHKILEKEISRSNDFLANKSVMGTLFGLNDSTQLFLFTTHVQALGTKEHKEFQLEQIYNFMESAVKSVVKNGIVSASENLIVLLAGDFNSNAYSLDRFNGLRKLLGFPRDLHKEYHGTNEEYTFIFREGRPSRRFDYIFAYDKIGNYSLKKITLIDSGVEDVKDDNEISISDHLALKARLLIK